MRKTATLKIPYSLRTILHSHGYRRAEMSFIGAPADRPPLVRPGIEIQPSLYAALLQLHADAQRSVALLRTVTDKHLGKSRIGQ